MHKLKYRGKVYLLSRDPHCFSIKEEKKNEKGEFVTIDVGFYSDLECALRALINRHALDYENLTVMESIRKVCIEMRDVINNAVEVSDNSPLRLDTSS